jgi:hypothetical protein
MPARVMPRLGARVSVRYLGATVGGTVEAIEDDARRVTVRADDGEVLSFLLNQAIARFTLGGESWGARLSFEDEPAASP